MLLCSKTHYEISSSQPTLKRHSIKFYQLSAKKQVKTKNSVLCTFVTLWWHEAQLLSLLEIVIWKQSTIFICDYIYIIYVKIKIYISNNLGFKRWYYKHKSCLFYIVNLRLIRFRNLRKQFVLVILNTCNCCYLNRNRRKGFLVFYFEPKYVPK